MKARENFWAFVDGFGVRTRPHYGQVVLWALHLCAWPLAIYFVTHRPNPPGPGERIGPATVLSVLPDWLLGEPWAQWACFAAFCLGSPLWVSLRGIPFAGWLTALSFTGVVALHMENANQCTHVAHLTNGLLILHALWYYFYAGEIRQARIERRFWIAPLYPRWVYSASIFYVGLFYGFSGLGKLLHSGLGWSNGTSLQLWTVLFGDSRSLCSQFILHDRRWAAWMQAMTLIGETGSFVAIVSSRVRPWIGLALIGFHLSAIAVFGWGFHANALIIALVFLPFYRWIPSWAARISVRESETIDWIAAGSPHRQRTK